ncbi:MAG: RNA polymerase factor sigma-54 [Rhodospirillales bacterium]|jgi:RNA polymerase sigma-54 factor|nr:RNA polymerase factor sigma-54 [Rhodospirillales bacterium]HJO96917.1 RNA polymerase factor sigma-54 [Rhodospirillales bacterium]
MAMIPRLELRQSQALVMTPQLQQAIKLLQLSSVDLLAYVEQELEQNPLLERDDGGEDGLEATGVDAAADDDSAEVERDPDGDGEAGELAAVDRSVDAERPLPDDDTPDVDYDNQWNNDSAQDAIEGDRPEAAPAAQFEDWGSSGGGFEDGRGNLEQILSDTMTLREHLVAQLNMDISDAGDRMIGLHLIDMLDEAGYLTGDVMQVATLLGCAVERVERTLARLQTFDPPGIFARNLAECLGLQLKDRNRLDPAIQTLLDNLDLLAKRDLAALTRLCGMDADDLAEMVAEIRALDPKPATAFEAAVSQPVTPDVLMRPQPGGGWIIELNSDTLPRVLVSNHYYARIAKEARSKTDRQYIHECFQSASWLVKSLHQRATTILKVATEIVRQQDGFFAKGVSHLRPLVLRDIALAIDMHESTVSRVTSNKYMATPRGIFELKYFFTPAIANSSGGEAHSAEAVRHRIKTLIDAEEATKVLSDDGLVALLQGEGIDIARRTVAKYREALGLPSSVQRRREKTSRL